jgi:predicted aspartyl protease
VSVTIEENAGKGLLARGESLPTAKAGLALIDTGASGTCIDEQAAKDLGLPVIDVAKVTTVTQEDLECYVYPVRVNIIPGVTFNCPRTIGTALAAQGLLILVGRDVLQQCNLFYDGLVGQFTLAS